MNGIGDRPKLWDSDPTTSETTDRSEASFKDFGTSMNAISIGFVATAILISMFLIMAIFEHILRPRPAISPSRNDARESLDAGDTQSLGGKLSNSRPMAATLYPTDFSVLMPGQLYPTYIAQPAPLPCQREGMHWPCHASPTSQLCT